MPQHVLGTEQGHAFLPERACPESLAFGIGECPLEEQSSRDGEGLPEVAVPAQTLVQIGAGAREVALNWHTMPRSASTSALSA